VSPSPKEEREITETKSAGMVIILYAWIISEKIRNLFEKHNNKTINRPAKKKKKQQPVKVGERQYRVQWAKLLPRTV
jgi:hypothetical protein